MHSTLKLFVRSITLEAAGILSFELRSVDATLLPAFTAGAHIDLHLAGGLIRSYSLLNSQDERYRYVIAVQREEQGRGGSRLVHELRVGEQVNVSGPRNNFPLVESAPHCVLVAGGIGITPLWSMVQQLHASARSWELFYCVRTRAQAALLDRIDSLPAAARGRVHLNFDHEPGGCVLDLAMLQSRYPAGTHFYCCGPIGMLEAFKRALVDRPCECVHLEYFAGPNQVATEGGFTVELARMGKSLPVIEGMSILQTLLDAGIDVPHSCKDGICGSCEVRVLAGEPDHRDLVLSSEEQERNSRMMICCSGSKSKTLVLDL